MPIDSSEPFVTHWPFVSQHVPAESQIASVAPVASVSVPLPATHSRSGPLPFPSRNPMGSGK
jgi:hypothetical protein